MKKILCFGDSNTYGFNPQTGTRYNKNERWSGILQDLLKDKFEIIEKGCNNRTCFMDNPNGIEQTGYKILPKILKNSFDIIILSLGINDIQKIYNPSLEEFKKGLENFLSIAKEKAKNSDIILVCPAKLNKNILESYFSSMFNEESIEKSEKLVQIYQNIAINNSCYFINLNEITQVSQFDGLHHTKEEHKKIAKAIYNFLNKNVI